MSEKSCKKLLCHVMALTFLFTMRQNRIIEFSLLLQFENYSHYFYSKYPIFYVRIMNGIIQLK